MVEKDVVGGSPLSSKKKFWCKSAIDEKLRLKLQMVVHPIEVGKQKHPGDSREPSYTCG